MKKVSILVPCYNEERSLPLLYQELSKVMAHTPQYQWEVLLVNDGSHDATHACILELQGQDPRINYLKLTRNFGKENAMLAGFDYVTGDCTILLDADLQDPPSLIPEMLTYWEQGYQDVYARRRTRGHETWLRRRLSLLFYKILAHACRYEMLPNVGDFRLLDRQCVQALRTLRESERYTKGLFCWIGFRKKELLFDRGDRVAGHSKWEMWTLLNLAIDGICSFTTAPLRMVTVSGAVIAFFSFLFLLFYVTKTLIWGDPARGFTTLIAAMLFLGGVQLLAIGILGEYVGRIFNEAKRRPNYLAESYNGKEASSPHSPTP